MGTDFDRAREQGRNVWNAMAPGWEAFRQDLWELSRPVSEWLVDRLDVRPGQTILDLAAGVGDTGLLAARRLGQTGRVIITDFAPEMVAAARRRAAELGIANAECRELDAERMDLAAESVDGVTCRWGYMLMPDPNAALGETHRVLRAGGRLAFSVFAAADLNPWASLVGRILVTEGHLMPPAPGSPGIFALSDPARIRDLLARAGFEPPELEEVRFTWRFPTREAYWWFLTEMAGAISPVLRGLTPEAQAHVRARIDDLMRPFRAGEGYALPAVCSNVATRKPVAR
jgi:ubiquinone/menaquinone biosynthesis C-methylase UbiE